MYRIVLAIPLAAALLICAGLAQAQDRRIALVIGNNDYASARPLTKPVNDAQKVAQVLATIGFDVEPLANLDHTAMTAALQRFGVKARSAHWAIVYFSGHGSEVNGSTQIFPIDGGMSADGSRVSKGLSLDKDLIAAVQGARTFKAIILDACRADPFAGPSAAGAEEIASNLARNGRVGSGGLVRPKSALDNMLVIYAAQAGDVAYEGDGPNSFFTTAFLEHVRNPEIDVTQLVGLVTQSVMRLTGNVQRPGMYGTPIGSTRFFFAGQAKSQAIAQSSSASPKPTSTQQFTAADRKVLSQLGASISVCTVPAKVEVECGPKASPSEKLICSNYELLRLDAELNGVWDCIPKATRKTLGPAQKAWWQTARERCVAPGWNSDRVAVTNSWVCLSAMYLSRIQELRNYL